MAVSAKKKSRTKGLGRGLDALLGDAPKTRAASAPPGAPRELPIEHLAPNRDQPRQIFDKASIEELALSIKARGMLAPILVRPKARDMYEIVAGERRWRAAQKARLHTVPVIIRKLTDEEAAEIALIENVQRVDLNPVEEAAAYHHLANNFGRKQEEIARAVGKSRSHVANIMRLAHLPDKALDALTRGEISMGHARALLGADSPDQVCKLVLKEGLSVRETERLINALAAGRGGARSGQAAKSTGKSSGSSAHKDADTRALERDLAAVLGLDVSIAHAGKGAGSLTLKYMTLDQLDDLCRRLMGAGV